MDVNPSVVAPERIPLPHSENGNARVHQQGQDAEATPSQNESGLDSGKDRWFQQGYRAGYLDGLVHGLKQTDTGLAGTVANTADRHSPPSKKARDHRELRLRGLPCAVCGCSSYTDEKQCPCCGTPNDQGLASKEVVAHD